MITTIDSRRVRRAARREAIAGLRGARETHGRPPDAMRPRPFRVTRVHQETHDTFTLDAAADGGRPHVHVPARPVQHALRVRPGEVPISMSGRPGRCERVVHTLRAVGPVTEQLHRLRTGDIARPARAVRHAVAGRSRRGVRHGAARRRHRAGAAPARASTTCSPTASGTAASTCCSGRARRTTSCSRRRSKLWRGRFDVTVEVVVDRAATGWHGFVGVVTSLVPRAPFDPHNAVAFVCGPEIMMKFGVAGARRARRRRDRACTCRSSAT